MERLVQKQRDGLYRLDSNKAFLQDGLKKLYEYEDAEEQGLLIKLPCKVGDMVYIIHVVSGGGRYADDKFIEPVKFGYWCLDNWSKTVFLTREAAEEALKGGE